MKDIQWTKKGLIYKPDGSGFFKSHVTRTIPVQISDEVLRIFFSSRDDDDRPFPTYLDLDIKNPSTVLHVSEKPLMGLGRIGTFDDSGVTPVSIINATPTPLCYYVGWKRRRIGVTIEPTIGLAKIVNNDSREVRFERVFEGPILAQNKDHPILVAAPFVLYDDETYKMWYCSGTEWRVTETGPEPIYRVHYAESNNGIDWNPHPTPCIDYKFDGEVISAPWVMKIAGVYHMWYSTRGSATRLEKNYTIGYAFSPDGINWERRDDEVTIVRSAEGWDSEMVCYPSFFSYGDITYMFYCGNAVGKGGFGYATAPRFC